MFAKTFDWIYEDQAVSWQIVFAQLASKWEKEAPEPPPINLLGLPFAIWRQLSRSCTRCKLGKLEVSRPRYTKYVAVDIGVEAHPGWRARFGGAGG
eukprot:668089-Prymnesium_polylepis.1